MYTKGNQILNVYPGVKEAIIYKAKFDFRGDIHEKEYKNCIFIYGRDFGIFTRFSKN